MIYIDDSLCNKCIKCCENCETPVSNVCSQGIKLIAHTNTIGYISAIEVQNAEMCVNCRACEDICSQGAIKFNDVTYGGGDSTMYLNVKVFENGLSTSFPLISGATVKFYTSTGLLLNTGTTNTNGTYSYSTSQAAAGYVITKNGYIEARGTVTAQNYNGVYTSAYLTANNPSVLTKTNTWYNINGSKYVGKGATYAKAIKLSSTLLAVNIDSNFPDKTGNLLFGTAIVEMNLPSSGYCMIYDRTSDSYNSGNVAVHPFIYDFSTKQYNPAAPGLTNSGRKVLSTHYVKGANYSGEYTWGIGAKSGTPVYNGASGLINSWVSYTDKDGAKYFSYTANKNNLLDYVSISVKKDYIYTFSIHTYSEVNADGFILSKSIFTSDEISSIDDAGSSDDVLICVSGVHKSTTYTYNAKSTGTLYLYFITDVSNLGNSTTITDSSTGTTTTEWDKYSYADVQVVEKYDGDTFTFSSSINAVINGNQISLTESYTKQYLSSDPIVLPRPYDVNGLKYCDTWYDQISAKTYNVGVAYHLIDFSGTSLVAKFWKDKTKVSIPTVNSPVYNGSVQKTVSIDENIITYGGTIQATNVGEYNVGFKLVDTIHYIWSDNTDTDKGYYTWHITKRPITITAKSNSKTYDGSAIQTNGSTASNIVSGHTYTITLTRTGDGINAGTYTVTPSAAVIKDASGNDVTSNYDIKYALNTLTVNKKTVDIIYSPIVSSSIYCTDTAESKSSLVSTKFLTISDNRWGIESGGDITYTLQVNSGSSTVSGWSLDSFGKTLTIPSGTAAGTYKVSITIYAAATTNYNSTSDVKQITVNVVATSISSYGSVSAPSISSNNKYFPASGGTLSTSNITTYFNTSGSSQTITYNNGKTRSGSISYTWSGNSVSIPSLGTTVTTSTTSRTISFTYTATGEGGKSNSATVSSINQLINSESAKKDGGISSYGTPSTPTASNTNNAYLCGGGKPTLSSSVTNTRRYYTTFTSGATKDYPTSEAGTVSFVKTSDTNNVTGTTQQNNWSISGSTLTHRHMGTEYTTDTCVIVAKNAGDTSKVSGNLTLNASNWRTESNITYAASCSIGSGMTAAGGSAIVSYSAYHTANYTYQSGSTDTSRHTTTGDSASIAIQTNGNSRFSLSGSTLSHSNMTTNETTDTVVIRCTNNSDTASSKAYKDATTSITNSLSWNNPVISHTSPIALAVTGQTYTMSPSITQSGTYTSGSTKSNTSATYSYAVKTAVSGYSLGNTNQVSINNNTSTSARNGFVVTITATANGKSSTKDVTFNQVAGSKVYNTPTITKFAYDSFPASGATKTPSVTYSQTWTWNGVSGSGGTLTSGGTLAYTSSGTIPSGFSVSSNYATTGSVIWTNRTTTVGSARSAKTNLSVKVSMNGKTSAAYTCTSCDQVANAVTSTTKPILLGIKWDKLIPASGGTATPSFTYSQTRTYTSGSSDYPSSGATITYASAKCLRLDPEFYNGNNSIYTYDNAGSGKVSTARITSGYPSGISNKSGAALKITHTGTGTTPGMGGWYFAYTGSAGSTYVCTFDAWIPEGYRVEFASNGTGDNTTRTWETLNYGYGRWQTYSYRVTYGTSGTISSTFFFYLVANSSASYPVTWYVANATICQTGVSASSMVNTSTGAVTLSSRGTSVGNHTANESGAVLITVSLNGQTSMLVSAPTQQNNAITTHSATTSISNNFSATGGYGDVTGSCTRTYTSGSKDSVGISKVEITSNGNSRFSLSGTRISHSSMGTTSATDKVSFRTTFTDGTTATNSSVDIVNKLESISLTLTPSTIKYGASSVPTATATYTSGGKKDVTATYTSSDTNVAKVE